MCQADPEKRIKPKDALKHNFFTEIEDHQMEIEHHNQEEKFQEYQIQNQ